MLLQRETLTSRDWKFIKHYGSRGTRRFSTLFLVLSLGFGIVYILVLWLYPARFQLEDLWPILFLASAIVFFGFVTRVSYLLEKLSTGTTMQK